jgi:hypothetical protein
MIMDIKTAVDIVYGPPAGLSIRERPMWSDTTRVFDLEKEQGSEWPDTLGMERLAIGLDDRAGVFGHGFVREIHNPNRGTLTIWID